MAQIIAKQLGCAAPEQTTELPSSVDLTIDTVITGVVEDDSNANIAGAYVRLLDANGEFTAEVVTGDNGVFRFFAKPGSWTLRALSRAGDASESVDAVVGLNERVLHVSR